MYFKPFYVRDVISLECGESPITSSLLNGKEFQETLHMFSSYCRKLQQKVQYMHTHPPSSPPTPPPHKNEEINYSCAFGQ